MLESSLVRPLSPHLVRSLGEPVAWQGPVVMNTREELRTAFRECLAGTFVRQPKPA
jgi:hypothetical protein